MLELKDYNVFAGEKQILTDINAKFDPGVHVIMGANGSGKSTLAQSIMGHYDYRTTGIATIFGIETHALAVWERARHGLFVSAQHPVEMTGISNFAFILRALQSQDKEYNTTKLLADFKRCSRRWNLPEDWHKRDLNVDGSGGEKKKNEFIQIEMLRPELIILDEPDSGLDVDAIKELVIFIHEMKEDHDNTVLLISHYETLITDEDVGVDSVIVLTDGKISDTGDIELAKEKLKNGFR